MTARHTILNALHSARGLPSSEQITKSTPVLQAEGNLTDAFEANARALLAQVYRAHGWPSAWQQVETLIRDRAWQTAVTWDTSVFPVSGLTDALARSGCRTLGPAEWKSADVGITGADAGIAATGSLVLASGPGKPRSASLLPEAHVALLAESRIVPTMEAWVAANSRALPRSAGIVFVSGPSRSGDIEMVVTLGVHGPGEVHIVLVCGE